MGGWGVEVREGGEGEDRNKEGTVEKSGASEDAEGGMSGRRAKAPPPETPKPKTIAARTHRGRGWRTP